MAVSKGAAKLPTMEYHNVRCILYTVHPQKPKPLRALLWKHIDRNSTRWSFLVAEKETSCCERQILKLQKTQRTCLKEVFLLSGMISHKPGQCSNQSSNHPLRDLWRWERMGISCHFEPSKTPSLRVSVGHWPFRKCHKERSTWSQLGILSEIPSNRLGKKNFSLCGTNVNSQ